MMVKAAVTTYAIDAFSDSLPTFRRTGLNAIFQVDCSSEFQAHRHVVELLEARTDRLVAARFDGKGIARLNRVRQAFEHRRSVPRALSITRQAYMPLICWTGGSGTLQGVRISMVSSATILVVLVVLFLVSIKWTIDVIGGWPHKIPISRYLEQQRSRPVTANRQTGGDSFLASVLA